MTLLETDKIWETVDTVISEAEGPARQHRGARMMYRYNQKKHEALINKVKDGTLFMWSEDFYELQLQKRQRSEFLKKEQAP